MSPPSVRGTGVVIVPPFSGGLHCGAHTLIVSPVGPFECPRRSTNGELYSGAKAYGVISGANADDPAVQRRAPLRPAEQPNLLPEPVGCSRSLTAGSMEAAGSRTGSATTSPDSRSLTAGSIAARTRRPRRQPGCRCSRLQRRAPLRRFELQADQRVRPVCSRRSAAGSNVATSMSERHHEKLPWSCQSSERERQGGDSEAGERSHAGQRTLLAS